jgi:hypothetical protein
MTQHDDDVLDSIAVLALGALPDVEAEALRAHIVTCEGCRAAYRELRAAADLVGYDAELAPGQFDELRAARLKARIMAAVAAPGRERRPLFTADEPDDDLETRPAPRNGWAGYALAAAALVLAGLIGIDDYSLHGRVESDHAQIAALQRHVTEQDEAFAETDARARTTQARLALLLQPGNRHFGVPGGEILETHDARIVLAMQHMPALPAGKVYQAWTLARGATTVAPSITFTPGTDGSAVIELPESARNIVAIAVSVEPSGGSKAPTSKASFLRPLS